MNLAFKAINFTPPFTRSQSVCWSVGLWSVDSVSDTRILLRYGLKVELRSEAKTAIDDIEDMEDIEDIEERGK